jgi:ElaB/YqjD/DUF883 family membrane-anchored ribosome-binding protein
MATEKDLADHLATIRQDLAALTETVSQLATDTAGIQASLKKRVINAARQATAAGEHAVHEAAELGNEAIHAAGRQANAAFHGIEHEIERNPLTAVLVALGFGVALGLLTRK